MSPNTMSTVRPSEVRESVAPPPDRALPDNVPDAALIARMANEIFGQWGSHSPTTGPGVPSLPSPSASPPPFVIWGPPDVVASAMVPTELSIPAQTSVPIQYVGGNAPPAAAATPPIGAPMGDGEFSFLEDIRPLFFTSPVGQEGPKPSRPAAEHVVIREPAPAEHPARFSFLADLQPVGKTAEAPPDERQYGPPSPVLPGAFGDFESPAFPAFSFLEEARPLFSSPQTMPGPVPVPTTEVIRVLRCANSSPRFSDPPRDREWTAARLVG
jgi:cysteine desulfurase/selenocysteine lyase